MGSIAETWYSYTVIRAGDRAPDFTGTLADNRQLRSRDFRGRRHLILYFFPKDFTPG